MLQQPYAGSDTIAAIAANLLQVCVLVLSTTVFCLHPLQYINMLSIAVIITLMLVYYILRVGTKYSTCFDVHRTSENHTSNTCILSVKNYMW